MKPSFDLDRIADLARLELTAEERPVYLRDMEALVAFADTLDRVERSSADMSPCGTYAALRAETPAPCLPRHELLQGSATHTEEYFTVPRAIAQEGSHE